MSKMIQGIKYIFGMKPEAVSSFEKFHETADRVSAKTELLLSERNGFAQASARMRARGTKKKVAKR